MSNDDPIVLAGKPGASHHHTFIGNRAVNAESTAASLISGESSCEDIGDSSALWPTLFAGGRALRPLVGVGYYVRRTKEPVRAFPPGAGHDRGQPEREAAAVTYPSSAGAAAGSGRRRSPRSSPTARRTVFQFRATSGLLERKGGDSADHKRHMAYAVSGHCPRTHPVAVPTLVLILLYPETEQPPMLQASGRFGAHADFMNGWNQDTLDALVAALN